MNPPTPFVRFMEFWAVPQPLAKTFWRALARSQHPVARSWLHDIALFAATDFGSVPVFICGTCSPSRIMAVLEALAGEDRLTRKQASRIEDVVLTHVTRAGQWKGGVYDVHRLQIEEMHV